MSGLSQPEGYSRAWLGEADCYALPIDDETYLDLFTSTVQRKIETPLDRFGLVDKRATALAVLATAPKGHQWGPKKRQHHWQWPESDYPNQSEAIVNPHIFRNLPINIEGIPLSFERRLHLATLPPVIPEDEVMFQRVEAYQSASTLLRTAKEIIEWQHRVRLQRLFVSTDTYASKMNATPDKKDRDKAYSRHKGRTFSKGFRRHLKRYYEVPPEFRLAETGGSAEQVLDDLNKALGYRALRHALATS
jgi:hypothetical protein